MGDPVVDKKRDPRIREDIVGGASGGLKGKDDDWRGCGAG